MKALKTPPFVIPTEGQLQGRIGGNQYLKLSVQEYASEVVCRLSQTLIPLGKSVVKPCYGFGRIHYKYIPEEDTYIWLIPTAPDVEGNDFSYYEVAVKFTSELDREIFEDEAAEVLKRHVNLRIVDSANIFIVSPKCRATQIYRLKRLGEEANKRERWKALGYKDLVRGERIFIRAIPVIAKTPEKALKAISTMIHHFIWKRMIALAKRIGIQPMEYDMNPSKLKSLLINNVYIIKRELVERFITYMAELSKTLKEKLNQLEDELRLKEKIREELEQLGIPAKKLYWKFKDAINQIINIAKQLNQPESTIKILDKLKRITKHDRKIEDALLNGKYIIPEAPINPSYIQMPRQTMTVT